MTENKFKYMLYFESLFVGLFISALITTYVFDPLAQNFTDSAYYLFHLIITLITVNLFTKTTIKFFTKQGLYMISEDSFYLKLRNKEYKYNLNDILEVHCFKTNFLGFRYVILEIKFKGKKIKIFSTPNLKNIEIDEKDLYSLYEDLKFTNLFKEDEDIFLLKRK